MRAALRDREVARVSLWVGVLVTAVLFGWGAWQRRWMSDDGLIVLRTVRNMLAGNGPVFNAGERVEANTSAVWTYLMYLGCWLGGPMRMEYVALAAALALSVLGIVLVMLGTARLYAPGLWGRRALLLPAGALVYIAVGPARDFATSGLENGLVCSYLGLLWLMLVYWAQTPVRITPARTIPARRWVFIGSLAFVAGLSVLVRPELALIGGGALIMLLLAVRGWRARGLILVAGGLLPVAYQVFRMGYYALLVPGTALAKDAAGDKWSQGMIYLANFNAPYSLWVPAVLLTVLGLLLAAVVGRGGQHRPPDGFRRVGRGVQRPAVVVCFMVASGLLQAAYWVRQGGDFMHGRVLLVPLFCVLAPVAVIPVLLPSGDRLSRDAQYWLAGTVGALWLGTAGWALWAANSAGMGYDATRVTYSGIVDERRFYSQATGKAHPLTAADYLGYPRMRAVLATIDDTPEGALLLPSGNYDQWDLVPVILPVPPMPGTPPGPDGTGPHTVFFTNLGMLGMNTGLDVRLLDQIGLVNPLAAHTDRLQYARIGHDKDIFRDWVIADGPWVKWYPGIPGYLDQQWVAEAQAALGCPGTDAVLNSVRAPMGLHRFVSNFLHSVAFTRYRIDRVPRQELIRCGLDVPELPPAPESGSDSSHAPYTGLPAEGP
ncbi:MAG TPA: flagellar motor control protein ZomB [Mycobacterium sp.]|nr:flagellar motor control protein ZomB [Mycobacterium sp.]